MMAKIKSKEHERERMEKFHAYWGQVLARDPQCHYHGTPSGYNFGCRCEKCKAAKAAYNRQRLSREHTDWASRWEERKRERLEALNKSARIAEVVYVHGIGHVDLNDPRRNVPHVDDLIG